MTYFCIFISCLFLLAGCQVDGKKTDEGLISGHQHVTNSFVVSLPSNSTYKLSDVLTFTLTHPFEVTVTGTPRLTLTVGASTFYASYVGGSDTKNLTFSYTVQAGDEDLDGIAVASAIDLNGGSLIFNAVTDASTTLTLPSTAGIKVDTNTPSITSVVVPPVAHYYTGASFLFKVNFSEAVVVTGTPSLDFTLSQCTPVASVIKKANYVTGSGTNQLTFLYLVDSACNDTDGDNIPVNASLQLNGGTIKDFGTNISALTLTGLASPLTSQIRGRYPLLSQITQPANGTYIPGQTLDFSFKFDRAVTVTGTLPAPYVSMTLGLDTTKELTYVSGSGTDTLLFRYTVIGGDVDADGISLSTSFVQENKICASATAFCLVNLVTDTFSSPVTTGVKVNGPIPAITGIQLPSPLPASGYYKLGDNVQVVVKFSEPVTVLGGTPLLQSTVGVTARNFSYLSGSGTANLIFNYTIVNTDLDTNGVDFVSPLNLSGATIQNASGTNADMDFLFTINPLFRFDGVPPTITASSLVANAPSAVNYRINDYVTVAITFSEDVTVVGSTMALTINGVTRNAAYYATGSTTNVKQFRYQVVVADANAGKAAVLTIPTTVAGGTIQDVALNDIVTRTSPAINTAGIDVDGVIPVVSSFTLPANGTYKNGDVLNFTVNFSEPVVVVNTPTWNITLTAGGAEAASYVSGSGTSALIFSYTVDSDDVDANGITTANAFTFGGGSSISDSSVGNGMNTTLPARNTTLIKVDGVSPTVTSLSGVAGTFDVAENVDVSVVYSEAVTITGSPQLQITVGVTTKYATYVSGSGTTTILYRYAVEAGMQDLDGVRIEAHNLNGGTIKDAALNNANLTTTPQTLATVKVDAQDPTIASITPPANAVKVTGNTLSFTVTYDEPVTVNTNAGTTLPTLSLNIGGSIVDASYASGSGSATLVFTTAALTANEFDLDGIAYDSGTIALNGGTIQDSKAHAGDLTFTTGSLTGIKVIYSSVRTWLDMGTTAGATIASVTSSSPAGLNATAVGTVSRTAVDSDFNNHTSVSMSLVGSDYLSLASIAGVSTIFVVFKVNSTPASNELVSDGSVGINLLNGTDLDFGASARYAIDGGALSSSATGCVGCYSSGTKIIMLNFDSAQSLGAIKIGNIDGKIAEVWILNNSVVLSDAQLLKISTYLGSRY